MYIEPCCAERQIGMLMREERGRVVAFQTSGDVTLEHWMKAVMLMSGDRPRTFTLSVPTLTDTMMRVIGRYMRQEWISTLRLMTTDPVSIDLLQQLKDYTCGKGTVMLAADASVPDGLLAFSGPDGTVIIQGRINDTVMPRLSLYAGIFGKTEGVGVRTIMAAWNANFNARRYEVTTEPLPTENPTESQSTKQSKKKRTNRKNIKKDETKSVEIVEGAPQSKKEAEGAK